jgi:hypothetical protein
VFRHEENWLRKARGKQTIEEGMMKLEEEITKERKRG